jgi:hypothetical protein
VEEFIMAAVFIILVSIFANSNSKEKQVVEPLLKESEKNEKNI